MATHNVSRTSKAQSRQPIEVRSDSPDTWPVVWRVVVPNAGSYDHDMVLTETEDQQEALASYRRERRSGWPVRLERVSCGPMSEGSPAKLRRLRDENPQRPGTDMREVAGYWEAR